MQSIRKPRQPTLFLPSVITWSAGNWSEGWTSSVNHSKQLCPQKHLPVEYQAFQFRTRKSVKNSDKAVSGNTSDENRLASTCFQDLWDSCPVHDWEKTQRWSSPHRPPLSNKENYSYPAHNRHKQWTLQIGHKQPRAHTSGISVPAWSSPSV